MRDLLFLVLAVLVFVACSSDSGTVDPDPTDLTLDGIWQINTFSTILNDAHTTLFFPNDIRSTVEIRDGKYWETGNIFNISVIDSGNVTVGVDSLEFFSLVLHKDFTGILFENGLLLNKFMSLDYFGTGIYTKN